MPPVGGWKTGVYVITNVTNGKLYVGSASISLSRRWKRHLSQLKKGEHFNRHLQSSWDKHGGGVFEFRTVCRCPPSLCVEMEQEYICMLMACERRYGYNLSPTAGSVLGVKLGEEAMARHSARMKSEKFRAAISKSKKGKKRGEAFGIIMSKTLTGRKLTAEHRENISKSIAGRPRGPMSEEKKVKLSIAVRKAMTPEVRMKMSESAKNRRKCF